MEGWGELSSPGLALTVRPRPPLVPGLTLTLAGRRVVSGLVLGAPQGMSIPAGRAPGATQYVRVEKEFTFLHLVPWPRLTSRASGSPAHLVVVPLGLRRRRHLSSGHVHDLAHPVLGYPCVIRQIVEGPRALVFLVG